MPTILDKVVKIDDDVWFLYDHEKNVGFLGNIGNMHLPDAHMKMNRIIKKSVVKNDDA